MTDEDWKRIEEEWEEPDEQEERHAKSGSLAGGIDMLALEKAKTKKERDAILARAAAAQPKPILPQQQQQMPAGFDMEAFQNAKTDEERNAVLSKVAGRKAPAPVGGVPGAGVPASRPSVVNGLPNVPGAGIPGMPAGMMGGGMMGGGMMGGGGAGMEGAHGMVFVTVHFDGCCPIAADMKLAGCCPSNRKHMKYLARKWSSLLASTGMDAAFQVWKDDQLMFETKHEAHVGEITDFAMLQPEAMVVRHNQQDTYGPSAPAEWKLAYEKMLADREAAKAEKIRLNKESAAKEKARQERKAKQKKMKRRREKRDAQSKSEL